jgi:hypothetical protein
MYTVVGIVTLSASHRYYSTLFYDILSFTPVCMCALMVDICLREQPNSNNTESSNDDLVYIQSIYNM